MMTNVKVLIDRLRLRTPASHGYQPLMEEAADAIEALCSNPTPSSSLSGDPVAWWWEDKTGCLHLTLDRPDVFKMARDMFCEPQPLYSAPKDSPVSKVMGTWLPIERADKAITDVQDFPEVGMTIKTSDRYWLRDEDGRVYEAAWSEGKYGRDFWWDFEAESPVDPIEFMPHPLDPRFAIVQVAGDQNAK